ncbi:MAG: hypothetical protein GW748_01320 [Alphaproteobacteria bacterium]|nr:hypothetical protein [Alphaproteobacteria bacterium]NCQ66374.1 hypothetical protein [Alphaproteobacteria bacterium]NCT06860.1 hypothetical protein [Alphaproteobacteria bacterium]
MFLVTSTGFESELEVLFSLLGAGFVSFVVTHGMMMLNILDHPKERSSHVQPIPTSGGVAIICGFLTFITAYHFYVAPLITPPVLWILGGGMFLGLMGFVDEVVEISFLKRLAVQLTVSALVIINVFPYVDLLSLKFIVLLILLGGFVNAYNFFDGLNGLAGTAALIVSLFAFLFFSTTSVLYLALVPGLLGFLYWNYKGKIIQGDVGTFFTGFCLPSFLLLEFQDISESVLVMGYLFFPVLFDISATVALRLLQRKSVTTPHKGFFFHQLNLKGWPHLKVTSLYAGLLVLQGFTAFIFNMRDPFTLGMLYLGCALFYSTLFWFLLKYPAKP